MSSRKSIREDVQAIADVYDATDRKDAPIRVRCATSTLIKEARREGSGFICIGRGVKGGGKGSRVLRVA